MAEETTIDDIGEIPRIRPLSAALTNQIAAGEVIERPASVVKELLENSLDAGARRLHIEVEGGGAGLIRVRDDGFGIHPQDLALAVDSHATSKIRSLADLEDVDSLGFRGEALSSIASVSRFCINSRTRDESMGWSLRVEGGDESSTPEPVAHPPGTSIEVRELFYNTPGRRKFLRAEKTEFRHIETVVRRAALSHFSAGFELVRGGQRVFQLAPATEPAARTRRVARLCGQAFVDNALALEYESAGLRLSGWLGLPPFSRSQTDMQYFLVNRRAVQDRLLQHGVRQAFEDLLYPGRQPTYVLYLELDPARVDANVHPAKQEVRFHEARLVHDFIFRSLQRALEQSETTELPGMNVEPGANPPEPASYPIHHVPAGGKRTHVVGPAPRVREQLSAYGRLHGAPASPATEASRELPLGRAIGLMEGPYLLAENRSGLVLVDLRAAWRRDSEHELQAAVDAQKLCPQPLLLPVELHPGASIVARLEAEPEWLRMLALEPRICGPESVMVYQLPALLRGVSPEPLYAELFAAWEAGAGIEEQLLAILPLLARHVAEARRLPVGIMEMEAELRALEATDDGRDFWVQLDHAALRRLFP